ncbi:MAG: aldehyde dehydrogenase [Oligoflexus sp.]|nr:aldehyde dehydrogenase [Oligoflexus sp.]
MTQFENSLSVPVPTSSTVAPISVGNSLVPNQNQIAYFMSGATRSYEARRNSLLKLKAALQKHEHTLLEALHKDLRKHPNEGYVSELGIIYDEISHVLKGLKGWMKPRRVATPMSLQPASSHIVSEALGRVLVIAPWNYPLQLAINPAVGALAAGNVVMLKPSELTPHTSKAIATLVRETFDPGLFQVVEGGVDVSTRLLEEQWDHIFFTGSTGVGQIVALAAAKHLTPCTLELGGKSPCIVTRSANMSLAARRIVFGKLLNAGQTCVAPDYLLVEKGAEDELLKAMIKEVEMRYGQNPLENTQLPCIVNDRNFQRLSAFIQPKLVAHGGRTNAMERLIEPTFMINVPLDHPVMMEEIFGPILPIVTFDKLDDAIRIINSREHPLALYIFSENADEQERVTRSCRFGGGAINDTLMHLANANLPFGGVGKSGYGRYHGKNSFDCFVHQKAILKTATWFDMPIRYAPWTPMKDKLVRLFLR